MTTRTLPHRAGGGLHFHDPYRGGTLRALPRIADEPLDGSVSILAYVDRYPPFINAGAEWMLHAMLRDSVRRGHRVMVATGCVRERHDVEGVEVYPAAEGPALAEQAELVVGHLLWTNEAIRLAQRAELPLLYLVHNDSQVAYWRLTPAKVSAYVWNSEWIGAATRDRAGDVPAVVVRPPLVAADYAVTDPAPADREFVTLVNPIEAKGSSIFYRLAERQPDRRFLAVEGAYGSQVRPKARHRNVEWQRQTGRIRDDVLARTRVLLVPSSYESWGRAAVEAMAAGIPVIASPTPGLVEALGDGWPYFAPHTDLAAWERALVELDDPATYAEASSAALARADHLDELGRSDLDAWDVLCRRAARTTVERMAAHDPFRARSAPVAAQQPEQSAEPVEPASEVPELAADVAEWIAAADNHAEARRRADAAWKAEAARPAGVRKTVADAVTRILDAAQSAADAAEAREGSESTGGGESGAEQGESAS